MDGNKRTSYFDCAVHGKLTIEQEYYQPLSMWMPSVLCKTCAATGEGDRVEKERRERADVNIRGAIAKTLVPPRFIGKNFDNYDATCEKSKAALGYCKSYAEKFPALMATGTCMMMCGTTGSGKTHLACSISDYITRNFHRNEKKTDRYRVVFMETFKAIRSVKDTYRKGSTIKEQDAINALVFPDLLILDEVGVQFGSDAEKMILFEVINERYLSMKPTILISNLSLVGLTEFIGERVIDRMRENGGKLLTFDWKTHRGTKVNPN